MIFEVLASPVPCQISQMSVDRRRFFSRLSYASSRHSALSRRGGVLLAPYLLCLATGLSVYHKIDVTTELVDDFDEALGL
jgi:hypothetical protein